MVIELNPCSCGNAIISAYDHGNINDSGVKLPRAASFLCSKCGEKSLAFDSPDCLIPTSLKKLKVIAAYRWNEQNPVKKKARS